MEKVFMSFPGLGIGEFVVNKVAFTLPIFGGLEIRWYGIIITVGMILAVLYAPQRLGEVFSDKAGSTGNKNLHADPRNYFSSFASSS